jgi:hypothetical protein
MAHYAKVVSGIVTQVIVAEPEFFNTFIDDTPGEWVKTSYNMHGGVYYDRSTNTPASDQSVIAGDEARERKNFAFIGGTYDSVADAFYIPQPYNSWTLNTTSYLWEAPVAYPDSGFHVWNETDQRWDEVT